MWNSLSQYLDRFKKLQPPKEYKKECIQKIIKEKSGVFLNKENINLKGGVLYLQTTPLYKTEILLHKKEIEESFKKENLSILKIV